MPQEIMLDELLTIAHAEALSNSLEESFRDSKPVVFNGSHVKRVDMAILQLLIAFFSSMEKAGVAVSWSGVSDEMRDAARLIGGQSLLYL